MERMPSRTDAPPPAGWIARLAWGAVCLVLVGWQGWLVLGLFAAAADSSLPPRVAARTAWERLANDEPLLSGQHPLHLYHGFLGAVARREQDMSCCYDPAFQAGYPRTPLFDAGSRPAELFLALAGGHYDPAAYKLGFALCVLGTPLALWFAARCTGFSLSTSCLTMLLGQLACWSVPGQRLLEQGDLDLILVGLAGLCQITLLLRFDRQPGPFNWLGLFACGCVGWFVQPLWFLGALPLVLVHYFRTGARHALSWHLALWAGLTGGVLLNLGTLLDLFTYWWIRSPVQVGVPLLPHRTLPLIWASSLWGDTVDRTLIGLILLTGVIGCWRLREQGQRPAARLLGLGLVSLFTLAVAGLAWEPFGTLGTTRLLLPALWFAALPAACALACPFQALGRLLGSPWRVTALLTAGLLAGGFVLRDQAAPLLERIVASKPLALGLDEHQQVIVTLLQEHTTTAGRILWEDHRHAGDASHWSALLPLLTGRSYLGGLDLDRCIEHAYPHFGEQTLAGRPLADWTDAELRGLARRYAAGWVACWSPTAMARFRAWPDAEAVAPLPDNGWLFALPPPNFALQGKANLLHADAQRIVLTDVVPDAEGKVVLSLHYLTGLRAVPNRVQVEREPDAHDPIPFVRLRLPGPLARVTLTWRER
jgi:hypothetical protein